MGLWVVGRTDLGLSEFEFWRSTPRLIYLMLDRKMKLAEVDRRWAESRMGELCALVANLGGARGKGEKPFEPHDFFPDLPKRRKRVQSTEEMIAALKAATGFYGA